MPQSILEQLENGTANFKAVLDYIENLYTYTPSAFTNGTQHNAAEQNQGSAKVFYFAKLNHLSQEDTLKLFAEHYQAVLNTPESNDHQNIRQFMLHGWRGISFDNEVLHKK